MNEPTSYIYVSFTADALWRFFIKAGVQAAVFKLGSPDSKLRGLVIQDAILIRGQ